MVCRCYMLLLLNMIYSLQPPPPTSRFLSEAGFLNLSTIDIWRQILFVMKGVLCTVGMFSTIPSLC